jgi:hypothetical protein
MFFSDWRVLLRRWYAVLIGLVLTAAMCLGAAQVVSPSYQIKAMILVLPPKSAVGSGGNPFLGLSGLGSVADVVSRSMMDGNTVKSLVELGANDKYLVAQDVTSAGPVILITSTANTPAEANETLRIVKEQLPDKLLKLQEATHVPENSLITLNQISQDERPTIVRKSQIRAVFGVFALGLTLTLVLTGFLDGLLLRRRRTLNGEELELAVVSPARRLAQQPIGNDGRYPRPVQQNQPVTRFAQPVADTSPPTAPQMLPRLAPPVAQPSNRTAQGNGRRAQANGNPVQTNGRPAQSNGRPAQANGHPAQPNGRPADSRGYPTPSNGNPTQPNGYPIQPNGRPSQRPGGRPVQPVTRPVEQSEQANGEPARTGASKGQRRPAKEARFAAVFDLNQLPAAFREPSAEEEQDNGTR